MLSIVKKFTIKERLKDECPPVVKVTKTQLKHETMERILFEDFNARKYSPSLNICLFSYHFSFLNIFLNILLYLNFWGFQLFFIFVFIYFVHRILKLYCAKWVVYGYPYFLQNSKVEPHKEYRLDSILRSNFIYDKM